MEISFAKKQPQYTSVKNHGMPNGHDLSVGNEKKQVIDNNVLHVRCLQLRRHSSVHLPSLCSRPPVSVDVQYSPPTYIGNKPDQKRWSPCKLRADTTAIAPRTSTGGHAPPNVKHVPPIRVWGPHTLECGERHSNHNIADSFYGPVEPLVEPRRKRQSITPATTATTSLRTIALSHTVTRLQRQNKVILCVLNKKKMAGSTGFSS